METYQKMIMSGDEGLPPGTFDTFNPSDKHASITLSESDLLATSGVSSNAFYGVRCVVPITVPVYFEFELVAGFVIAGIGSINDLLFAGGSALWEAGGQGCAAYSNDGNAYKNGAAVNGFGSATSLFGVAYRPVERELYFRDAGGWMDTVSAQDPVARNNPIDLDEMVGLDPYFILHCQTTSSSGRYINGASGFTYAVPTGYQAGNFT